MLRLTGEMTAEWLHLPPPYPPGVGPLYGAELEAWYEDLQDILGSDTGGAKLARAPTCTEVSNFRSKLSLRFIHSPQLLLYGDVWDFCFAALEGARVSGCS